MTVYIALLRGINVGGKNMIKMAELKKVFEDVYLLFRNSIRNSKLANNLQKLDASATTRNWKTMNKLGELAKDLKK